MGPCRLPGKSNSDDLKPGSSEEKRQPVPQVGKGAPRPPPTQREGKDSGRPISNGVRHEGNYPKSPPQTAKETQSLRANAICPRSRKKLTQTQDWTQSSSCPAPSSPRLREKSPPPTPTPQKSWSVKAGHFTQVLNIKVQPLLQSCTGNDFLLPPVPFWTMGS